MAEPVCRYCGHTLFDHEHYRAGLDCGKCDCPRFAKKRFWHGATPTPVVEAEAEVIVFPPTTNAATWRMQYMSWVTNLPQTSYTQLHD